MLITRINQEIENNGKEQRADLILTKGGVYPAALYSNETLDVTGDFIEFLNASYKDIN